MRRYPYAKNLHRNLQKSAQRVRNEGNIMHVMHTYAEFHRFMQNSASKSANLCGILYYDENAEVSTMCKSLHYNLSLCGGKCRVFALSTSTNFKTELAHTCFAPFGNWTSLIFERQRYLKNSILINGVLRQTSCSNEILGHS